MTTAQLYFSIVHCCRRKLTESVMDTKQRVALHSTSSSLILLDVIVLASILSAFLTRALGQPNLHCGNYDPKSWERTL